MKVVCRISTPGIANEPFNDVESSDTIFRTSDGVDFYVHRVVLFLASTFFRDMFSLPQPPSDQNKPVIDVTESSKTIDPLFRLCYPVRDPVFPVNKGDTAGLIGDVLEAALKYQVTVAIEIMKGHFGRVSKSYPLQAYAIACRLQLEDEAWLAAKRFRESRLDLVVNGDGKIATKGHMKGQFMEWEYTISGAIYLPEMASISAGAYYRLAQYIRTGVKKSFCSPSIIRTKSSSPDNLTVQDECRTVSEHFNFPNSDITVVSSDNVEYRVHELLLRLSSPNILTGLVTNDEGKKELKLQEDNLILAKLFQILYPGIVIGNLNDISVTISVLHAARKYEMEKVIDVVKDRIVHYPNTKSLRLYFAFARIGLLDDATAVVRNYLTKMRVDALYVPDMEEISDDLYHQMLELRHRSIALTIKIMAEHAGDDSDCETDWWNVASPSGHTSKKPREISIATPIALRELKKLQAECHTYFVNHHMYQQGRFPDEDTIETTGTFNLKELYDETSKLYQKVDSQLTLLKLQSNNQEGESK